MSKFDFFLYLFIALFQEAHFPKELSRNHFSLIDETLSNTVVYGASIANAHNEA